MHLFARYRIGIVSLFVVFLLVAAAACTDDDDRDPGAPAGTGDGTPAGEFGVPTPGPDDEDDDPVSEGTPEHAYSGVEREPGERLTPEATPDEPIADRTVTPDADAVGPQDEGMFPDIRSDGPEFDNYTLTITGEMDFAATDAPISVELQYRQSAPDTFHLHFDGDDEMVGDVWKIGGRLWIREADGEVREDDGQLAEEFDISVYLTMLPEIERISDAEEVAQEDIDGRATTRYTIPAPDAVHYMPGMRDADARDPEGSIDIWLDDEANEVMRMTVVLAWMDDNDNERSADIEYQITNVGETEVVEIPDI